MNKQTKKKQDNAIVVNKKARHDFFLERFFEAGLVLEGWEVKSAREKQVQMRDSYVLLKDGEAWLLGAVFNPLPTTASHVKADAQRTRKLLLHDKELDTLHGAVHRKGYAVVAVNLHWRHNRVKVDIAMAKGKKQYDKRAVEKEKTWAREKAQLLKNTSKR